MDGCSIDTDASPLNVGKLTNEQSHLLSATEKLLHDSRSRVKRDPHTGELTVQPRK